MSDALRTDRRFQRVAVGLALESILYNGRDDRLLRELYESPSAEKISSAYRRLIASRDHNEREVAFWLELGLSQEPTTFPDKTELLRQIRQIEMVLYDILGRAGPNISKPLNDWLNYIANVGESINQGYWIDAKILMSRAVDASDETVSKVASSEVKMRYELGILRSETRRNFEDLLKASFRLKLPERRLDAIVTVQGLLLKLLRKRVTGAAQGWNASLSRYLVERLATAEKLLLQEDLVLKARKEIEETLAHLEEQASGVQDGKVRREVEEIRTELRRLLREDSTN
jgi:hypothetical protein